MQLDFKFDAGNNKEYKVDGIWDSAVYAKESAIGQLPGLYYLVSWKGYPKNKNSWELTSAIQYLWRLVTAYHKTNLKKPTLTSTPVDTALLIARPIAPLIARPTTPPMARLTTALTKKCGQPVSSTTTNKRAKKS